MRKYFIYFIIYSFLGFILERIINLIALNQYLDNSVMVGPYQPLYGVGILLAIIVYDTLLVKLDNKLLRYSLLVIVAILTTGLSEFFHGEGYEYFTGITLWNYNQTFTCSYPYVCALPTSMFGVISALTIIFLHPFVKVLVTKMPKMFFKWVFRILLVIFTVDLIYTFFFVLLE